MTSAEHALRVLEFDRVLETVSEHAVSEAGAATVRGLRPLAEPAEAVRALEAVRELQGLLESGDGWRLDAVPDLSQALRRLAVENVVLEASDLLACREAMAVARASRKLADLVAEDGLPGRWVADLWGDADLEKRIGRTFDDDGQVSDRASPELKRVRRALLDHRGRLVDRLTRYARDLPDRVRVADASVTIRNGRYCVPVRREGKGTVGGLVHDASASRQTLFVEPTLAIDAMNEIRELELREAREVERILRELSAAVRSHRDELARSHRALVALDSLRARASYAAEMRASPPAFAAEDEATRIRGARHPLLASASGGAVPFDLDLEPEERILLVSGPNAGGKTVLLKTIGLASALAQSGVLPPLGAGTRLPFFTRLFAVIGDEQSIDASLSTFGAQARNLAEILREAGPRDLVLIDEIGSATDPAEGGALAAATLRRLSAQARLTVASTHLGDLKRLGDESDATVNASLEFDSARLEPTYRLVRDRPGRSYALVIAARLGVPEDVLEDARSRLGTDHVSLDTLLSRLEEERAELDGMRDRLESRSRDMADRERTLEGRESALAEAEREVRRARETARADALRDARDLVEQAIEELMEDYGDSDSVGRRRAERKARGAVERELRESSKKLRTAAEGAGGGPDEAVTVGDPVRWGSTDRSGVLVEVRGDRGVVEVDGLRLTVPLRDLTPHSDGRTDRSGGGPSRPLRGDPRGRRPEFRVTTEVDLRGLRVEEVEAALHPAVDSAVVGELPWLRIIHGKGTGALRARVKELLDADDRIRAYRAGKPNEGGMGVTVVEFD